MKKSLLPVFDDSGTEVSRDVYWGQKELGVALGTTAPYVGKLLRIVGLLRYETKEPTAEALRTGAATYVTVDTADGPHRYPRWRKDRVLDVLGQALHDNPKPVTQIGEGNRSRRVPLDPPQPLDARCEALERRVEALERRLMRGSR
ncbi:hypothetical protein AAFM46_08105 [Arthrobacter sp. TMP15]|uniref:hypothetical protein n=1 Tax=Arthrobacter sp. TMP15 TaxID=3140789 RepID=UPI0031BBC0B8